MKQASGFGLALAIIFATTISSCNNKKDKNSMDIKTGITQATWGNIEGKEVLLYTLTNTKGVQVKISTYGGIVTSWTVPDKNDKISNVVLGFDSLSGYLAKPPYFGALIGRYGNRIAKGKFKIDSTQYTLATNNGANHLHGGNKGFDKVLWDAHTISDTVAALILSYTSKDGEEGYPGNLNVNVRYTLTDDDELKIEYSATTDKPTPVNLTNHSYFNLTGNALNTILDHTLMIAANHYTPVDSTLIPTGEIKSVIGTAFDFTSPKTIGRDIAAVPGGYDHNFVLNKKDTSLQKVAVVSDAISGRSLEVYTTQPGIQFYTGNFLDGTFKTREGNPINKNAALCLETQHFPDSPNEPGFPTTILQPGQNYHSLTVYKLAVNK
jgi:aldose 1-epimerase